MTNEEIIANIAVEIYGEDVVRQMLERGEEPPLHSALGWRMRGQYRIKEEEKHKGIEALLWKVRKPKGGDTEQFYKAKTYLYREDQVYLDN